MSLKLRDRFSKFLKSTKLIERAGEEFLFDTLFLIYEK